MQITGWIPLVLVVCVGCQAPLANTVHEIEDGTPYAGDWELAVSEFLANDDLEEAAAGEASVIGTVAIAIEGGDEERPDSGGPSQSFLDLLGLGSRDEPQRLVIEFRWSEEFVDEDAAAQDSTRYDAQILRVGGRSFLTVQRFAAGDRLDPWTTPLQRTFLIERGTDPEVVWLLVHPKQLVWSPQGYAGDFEFDPGVLDDEGSSGLVERFDDLLEFYAEQPDEDWHRALRARRVD